MNLKQGVFVKRLDDDSPLTPGEWPTTSQHNKDIFKEIQPNNKMMKKIYQVLYYERSKMPPSERSTVTCVYDIKITPMLLRRILEQSLKGRYNHARHRYKTFSQDDYQKKIELEAKDTINYKRLNVKRQKIEITFD